MFTLADRFFSRARATASGRMRWLMMFALLGFSLNATAGTECFGETLCIEAVKEAGYVSLRGVNGGAIPLTVKLTPELSNMKVEGELAGQVLQPGESAMLARLRVVDPQQPSSYRYRLKWARGDYRAVHDDQHVYTLPYQPGHSFLVSQGYNGAFSHNGDSSFAIDFKMPEGTPIFAAREGRVVAVKADSSVGGAHRKYEDEANYVVIQHPDGTYGEYLHLLVNSVSVRPGEWVRQGQPIGASGNTGFSSGPHLHFMVAGATPEGGRRSFRVQFRTSEGIVAELERGHRYHGPEIVTDPEGERGSERLIAGDAEQALPASDGREAIPAIGGNES